MKNGPYELIRVPPGFPGMKYRGKYAYEHTVVFWQTHGKIPKDGFEIHHLNGKHRDNRPENLKLISAKKHRAIHAKLNRAPMAKFNCDNCGAPKEMAPRNYRFKKSRGQKYFFCSQKCQGIKQHQLGGRLR